MSLIIGAAGIICRNHCIRKRINVVRKSMLILSERGAHVLNVRDGR